MQYNSTIGVNVQRPPSSRAPNCDAAGTATSNFYQRPKSPIYNSFWSQAPRPKQSYQNPEWNAPEEDWSDPYVPPTEDYWDQWAREEAEEKKAKDERKANKHEKRRKRMVAELPQRLAEALAAILQVDSAIEKADLEQRAAVDTAENMIAEKQGGPFWHHVFESNVKLNTLKRQRDNCVNMYKKLYRDLKKLDRKKSEEARETYKELRKRATKKEDKLISDSEDSDEPYERAGMCQEERSQGKDDNPEDPIPQRQNQEFNWEEVLEDLQSYHDAHQRSSNTAFSETHRADPRDCPQTEDESTLSQASKETDRSAGDEDEDEDEEFVVYKTRMAHESHEEVQAEFWNIADGDNVCCYCGNTCVVMQCPKFEECGLYACEHCKSSH